MTRTFFLIALFNMLCVCANAQTSAFTYQGHVQDGPVPANGSFSMKFRLYDAESAGSQVGAEIPVLVTITNAVFSVSLDFTSASFPSGSNRWLEVQIGPTTLAPRQKLGTSPFAIRSLEANKADMLSSACNPCVTSGQIVSLDGTRITGSVANADSAAVSTNALSLGGVAAANYLQKTGGTITGNLSVNGVLTGNGSGLTNLPATYGYFYFLSPSDVPFPIVPGAAIPFPRTGPVSGIARSSPSTFVLAAVGVYEVSWQVSVNESGQIAASVNGVEVDNTAVGRNALASQIVGDVLIETTVVNSSLRLVNWGYDLLTMTPCAGGYCSNTGSLVIKRIR